MFGGSSIAIARPWWGVASATESAVGSMPLTRPMPLTTVPQNEECKKNEEACNPPEGTQCYEGPHTSHGHGGLGTHYDIYQMFKVGGKCGWQYLGGKVGKGVVATPPPGVQPCSSYSGFQGRNKGR